MHQIDNSTARSSLPAPRPMGTPGYFSNGDPRSGEPATIIEDEWLNSVMMELLNVIKAAGLAPDKGNRSQLLQAIQALIAGGVSSGGSQTPTGISWGAISGALANQTDLTAALAGKANSGHTHSFAVGDISGLGAALDPGHQHAESGWCKLPGGTVIQWGIYQGYLGGEGVSPQISFPIAFPGGVGSVITTDINPQGSSLYDSTSQIVSRSQTGFQIFTQAPIGGTAGVQWAGCQWLAIGW